MFIGDVLLFADMFSLTTAKAGEDVVEQIGTLTHSLLECRGKEVMI